MNLLSVYSVSKRLLGRETLPPALSCLEEMVKINKPALQVSSQTLSVSSHCTQAGLLTAFECHLSKAWGKKRTLPTCRYGGSPVDHICSPEASRQSGYHTFT